jgi:hypothetical protein
MISMLTCAGAVVKDRDQRICHSAVWPGSAWLAWLAMNRRRLAVDMYSAVPSYLQLADQLRDAITAGEIAAREALPSLARMVQETGLSMSTVQRAVRVLVGEGLVVTVPGRGIFAAPRE